MKGATKDDAFSKIPSEIFLQIFSYLDFQSALKARCVSAKWKRLVGASRNITITCHLTDGTVSTAVNSIEGYPSIKIYDFLKPIPVTSATRGVGRILGIAHSIEIRNSRVNTDELMKVMKFATKSLENLSFHRCDETVLLPLLQTSLTFECLTKLSIGLNRIAEKWHAQLFRRLSENQTSFPSLTHFKVLYYELDARNIVRNRFDVTKVWNRYMAFVEVTAAFKDSLKTVEIVRFEYKGYRRCRQSLLIEIAELNLSGQTVDRSFWYQNIVKFEIGDLSR